MNLHTHFIRYTCSTAC